MSYSKLFAKKVANTLVKDITIDEYFKYLYDVSDFYWDRLMYYYQGVVNIHNISKEDMIQDTMMGFVVNGRDGLTSYQRFCDKGSTIRDVRVAFKMNLKWNLIDVIKSKEHKKYGCEADDIYDAKYCPIFLEGFGCLSLDSLPEEVLPIHYDKYNLELEEFLNICEDKYRFVDYLLRDISVTKVMEISGYSRYEFNKIRKGELRDLFRDYMGL